ncbi:hypothetical protein [Paenibacillus sedimenti]|uniref:Uncharacterized protein n=1 Tax=Paenibacillus sedimenti TaxID=2770274 RepID=A0A926QJ63_9BACL|nr:hypothetical protein [Paenibacillus sedimenti]MBD0381235.1 hypothetical protein [Paenibacillus sedimenti]
MKKVVLPGLIVDALDEYRELYDNHIPTMVAHSFKNYQTNEAGRIVRDFAADNFETFLRAMLYDYESEETLQDRIKHGVLEIYQGWIQAPIDATDPKTREHFAEQVTQFVTTIFEEDSQRK